MISERKVAGVNRSLVNAKSLLLKCVRVHCDGLLVPLLMYGREKTKSRIIALQMNSLRGLLDVRKINCQKYRLDDCI